MPVCTTDGMLTMSTDKAATAEDTHVFGIFIEKQEIGLPTYDYIVTKRSLYSKITHILGFGIFKGQFLYF